MYTIYSVRPFDLQIEFNISYKGQDTNFKALHLENLIILNCMMVLGKYNDEPHQLVLILSLPFSLKIFKSHA